MFDPSRYARMQQEVYLALLQNSDTTQNSHTGTNTLLGQLQAGTGLSCKWELESGERIECIVIPIRAPEETLGTEVANMMHPVSVKVLRWDRNNDLVSDYDFGKFENDI
jgi:hypothetical protein